MPIWKPSLVILPASASAEHFHGKYKVVITLSLKPWTTGSSPTSYVWHTSYTSSFMAQPSSTGSCLSLGFPHLHLTLECPNYLTFSSSLILFHASLILHMFFPLLRTSLSIFFTWAIFIQPLNLSLGVIIFYSSLSAPNRARCPSHLLLQHSVNPSITPLASLYWE